MPVSAAAAVTGDTSRLQETKRKRSQTSWFPALTCCGAEAGLGVTPAPPEAPGTCGPRKRPFNLPNMAAELKVPLHTHPQETMKTLDAECSDAK